jgi:RNA polymerase sigma-70 factor (ECF subfamily)
MPSRSPAGRDYGQDADATLVTLARAGDDEAFTEIVRRRHAKIRQYMRYLSGHADDGDDLAQQVLLRAWKGIGRLQMTAAFDGWLRRIMVTTWIDQAKRRKLDFAGLINTDEMPAPAQSQNENLDLVRALAALPPGARLCVVLAYHDGYTHDEIADLTGLPVGTVKSHIVRGAARLRSGLESYQDKR